MVKIYFNNEKAFIEASASYILNEATSSIDKKGAFTIALTGGNSPVKIYERLATSPYKEKFPWSKTYFFLGDERILPSEHNQSNIYMINQTLFSKVGIHKNNKILPDTKLQNPKIIAQDYEKRIKGFFKNNKPSFDLLLLGMGNDGHTASLFPNDDETWLDNFNLVIPTSKEVGDPKVYRISFGLPLINESKNILMLISGKDKKDIADELFHNMDLGKNPAKSPIPKIKNIGNFTCHIF